MPLRHCERGQRISSETAPELFRRFASCHDGVLVPVTALLFLCLTSFAFAFNFPTLTGRVVDQAGVIQSGTKSDIEEMLKNLEDKSGIQLVVATVKSLEGSDIETYANQLFRTWKLGEAKKNNGVLLLVAPAEHKVRIEVGYGLEGTLTDALSSVLISSDIVPRFKTGDFSGGIARGVDGIISILNGDSAEWQPKAAVRSDDHFSNELIPILFVVIFTVILIFMIGRSLRAGHDVTRNGRRGYVTASSLSGSSSWSSSSDSSSSSSSDSGFSGGGGSSGGGGASGSW
jgi:uncharacterized protein